MARTDEAEMDLEGPAGLVAAAAGTDRDEGHAVRAGDRAARAFRVEADERPDAHGDLLAVDDDADLFLPGIALVVLEPLGAGRELEPVDPERLAAELAADEPHGSARACALDVRDVHDRIAHAGGD